MAKTELAQFPFKNCLLSNLSLEQLDRLRPKLQAIDLNVRQVIYEPNVPIQYAYFPEQGVISVVSLMRDGNSIEVGTIGKEGMAGAMLLLETNSTPYQFFVQVAGHAQRLEASVLVEEADRNHELRRLILRYQSAFLTQTMQGAACNGLHSVQPRCCRWLLIARDRSESDEIKLTHEFLGLMLGVRRASVTYVLRPLQDAGLVCSNHGTITILNREGLERGACECYRVIADQQKQMLSGS